MGRPKGSKNKSTLRMEAAMQPPEVESVVGVVKKSAPAGKQKWTMRAGNNWDSAVEFEENPDKLKIPRDMVPEGMSLEWKTRSIWGQEQKQSLNADFRAGWTPVHREDFDGRFADIWAHDDSGYVVYEACILCARPSELTEKSRKREKRRADEQLAIKAEAFRGGEINATGANHPSALASNRISRTMERIEIPKD